MQRLQRVLSTFYGNPITRLFGKIVSEEDYQKGSIPFTVKINGTYYTKYLIPTTPQGRIATQGLLFQDDNFSDLFPYSDPEIYSSIVSTLEAMGYTEESASDILVEDVVTELKKFFYSAKESNLFEEDVEAKRYELMVDTDDNTSLAKYLSDLFRNPKGNNAREAKAIQEIINNSLIKKLKYEVSRGNDELSTILFNHSHMDFADPTEMYEAMSYLMSLGDIALHSKNGTEDYSMYKLIGDLIAYSFLEGGVQEANQFTKYIPIELLSQFGKVKLTKDGNEVFESVATGLQKLGVKQVKKLGEKLQSDELAVNKFTAQFAQNNIDKIKGVSDKEVRYDEFDPNVMYVEETSKAARRPVKIKDKVNKRIVYLYLPVQSTQTINGKEYRKFIRVPVVTNKYVTQYNPQEDLVSPVQNENRTVQLKRTLPIAEGQESPLLFLKAETNLKTAVEKLAKSSFVNEQQAILLENMLLYINPTDKLAIRNLSSAYSLSPEGNTLYIREEDFNEGLNSVIVKMLHELTHAGTNAQMFKFYNFNTETNKYEFNKEASNLPGYKEALAFNYVYTQALEVVKSTFKSTKSDTKEEIELKERRLQKFEQFLEIQGKIDAVNTQKDKTAKADLFKQREMIMEGVPGEMLRLWYSVANPLELVPNIMESDYVRDFFNGAKLKRENRSLLDKIFQRMRNLFKAVFPNLVKDSVSERALITLFQTASVTNPFYKENVSLFNKQNSQKTATQKVTVGKENVQTPQNPIADMPEITDYFQQDIDLYSQLPFERDLESLDLSSFYSETTLSGKLLSTLGITESDWLSLTAQEKQKIKDCN
jgi:hypothetical protein